MTIILIYLMDQFSSHMLTPSVSQAMLISTGDTQSTIVFPFLKKKKLTNGGSDQMKEWFTVAHEKFWEMCNQSEYTILLNFKSVIAR